MKIVEEIRNAYIWKFGRILSLSSAQDMADDYQTRKILRLPFLEEYRIFQRGEKSVADSFLDAYEQTDRFDRLRSS